MKKLLSCLLVLVLLVGCGQQANGNGASGIAQKFLDGVKNFDVKEMNQYLEVQVPEDNKSIEELGALKELSSKVFKNGFKVVKEALADDKKTAVVDIETEIIDMEAARGPIMGAILSLAMDGEFLKKPKAQQQELVKTKLLEISKDFKYKKITDKLNMIKVGEDWKVADMNGANKGFLEEFFKSMSGLNLGR